MYFRLHRLFPSAKPANSYTNSDDDPQTSDFSAPLPLRARLLLFTRFRQPQKQKHQKEQEQEQSQSQEQQHPKTVTWGPATIIPDQELHSQPRPAAHQRKSILKPATRLDMAMAQANLWELIHQSETKFRINHDYLTITADEETLDSWFRVEGYAMLRRANGFAQGKSGVELETNWGWQNDEDKGQDRDGGEEFLAGVGEDLVSED